MHTWLPWQARLLIAVALRGGIYYAQSQQNIARLLFEEGSLNLYNPNATRTDLLNARNQFQKALYFEPHEPEISLHLAMAAAYFGDYAEVKAGFTDAVPSQLEDPTLARLREWAWMPDETPLNPTDHILPGTDMPDPSVIATWQASKLPGDMRAAGYRYLWVPHGWTDGLTDVQRELVFKNQHFYAVLFDGLAYTLYEATGAQALATYGLSPADFAAFEAVAPVVDAPVLNPLAGQLASRPDVIELYGVQADGKSADEKERIFKELQVLRQMILPDSLDAEQQAALQTWLTTLDPQDFPSEIEYVLLRGDWIASLPADQQALLEDEEHYLLLDWEVNFYYEIYRLYRVQR